MIRTLRGAIAALLITAAPSAFAALYSSIYVFGDSLSDVGNNALVFDALGAPAPAGTLRTPGPAPCLPDFIPTCPYASNRYSNGPVWVEYLAQALGNGPLLPSLAGGTDFAYGGARVSPANPGGFPLNLTSQVAQFVAQPGPAAATALYIIAGGGNDARDVINSAGAGLATTAATYAAGVSAMINSLYSEGARNFLVVNVPDVGRTPALQAAGPGAVGLASFVSSTLDTALAGALAALSPAIRSGLHTLDAFNLTLGLSDLTSACAFTCANGASNTFFWDGIHPTTAGHQVIEQAALRALPEPGMIALLLMLSLAGFAARRRR